MRDGRRRLLALALGVGLAAVALEVGGRVLLRESPYHPGKQIRWIQRHLVADPLVGFLWAPNVTEADRVSIEWLDADPFLLTTDADGFLNTPDAIEDRRGGAVDVVGLGDSFVHNAYDAFREAFAAEGLAYYNLAMHRHSPPQYDRILDRWALALDPRWVLFGVTENDYTDLEDFLAWEQSGLDWFAYHSGTWCGPPVASYGRAALVPGIYSAWRLAAAHARRLLGDAGADSRSGVAKVGEYAVAAHRSAAANGARLLVVLIPHKPRMIRGDEPTPNAPDELQSLLGAAGVEVLDLRPVFLEQTDRRALFYRQDGHWNRSGMRLAARAILDRIAGEARPPS